MLLQPHTEYDLARLAEVSRLLLDTRGVVADAVVVWWFRGARPRGPAGWLAVACGVGIAVQLGSCLVEASYEGGFLRTLMWLSWGLLLALYASERSAGHSTSP